MVSRRKRAENALTSGSAEVMSCSARRPSAKKRAASSANSVGERLVTSHNFNCLTSAPGPVRSTTPSIGAR